MMRVGVVLAGAWLPGLGYCMEGVATTTDLWMFALLRHLRVGFGCGIGFLGWVGLFECVWAGAMVGGYSMACVGVLVERFLGYLAWC